MDTKIQDGSTALLMASQNGHTEIVRLLLKNKADVKAKINNHWTALMIAEQGNHIGIIQLLKEAGA